MHAAQRHAIAAAVSTALTTGALVVLGSRGVLGSWVPADRPWPPAVASALAMTLAIFAPFAAWFERVAGRRRVPAVLAPPALAVAFAAFFVALEIMLGRFVPRFVGQYLLYGAYCAAAFCGYWIPLCFIGRRR
jgi:hypothetical protein